MPCGGGLCCILPVCYPSIYCLCVCVHLCWWVVFIRLTSNTRMWLLSDVDNAVTLPRTVWYVLVLCNCIEWQCTASVSCLKLFKLLMLITGSGSPVLFWTGKQHEQLEAHVSYLTVVFVCSLISHRTHGLSSKGVRW